MISVLILTYNESANIERCLTSVEWSDNVLVVDSGSKDDTQQLASKLGADVLYRAWDNFANQRNFALEQGILRNQWVLHLDADEVVTPELREEILNIAGSQSAKSAYRIPFRLIFMGRWIKHAGCYPTYQVRFGCKDRLRFKMVGHGQRETTPAEEIGTLTGDLIHHNFSKGISEWISKHAQYASDEANFATFDSSSTSLKKVLNSNDPVERRRELKRYSTKLPFKPLLRFGYLYFWRFGFLDGHPGFRYSLLVAFYQWIIDLNKLEKSHKFREKEKY